MNNRMINNIPYIFLLSGAWITAILVFTIFIVKPETISTQPALILGYSLAGVSLGIIVLGLNNFLSSNWHLKVSSNRFRNTETKRNIEIEEVENKGIESLSRVTKIGEVLYDESSSSLMQGNEKISNWVIENDIKEILTEIIKIKDQQNGAVSKEEKELIDELRRTGIMT